MGIFRSVMFALGLTAAGLAGCEDSQSSRMPPTGRHDAGIEARVDAGQDARRDATRPTNDSGYSHNVYDASSDATNGEDAYDATQPSDTYDAAQLFDAHDAQQQVDAGLQNDAQITDAQRIEDVFDAAREAGYDAQRADAHDAVYADAQSDVGNPPACPPGEQRSFYNGPDGTVGVGNCRAGLEACLRQENGSFAYVTARNEVLPQPERCNNQDDNCNRQIDEGVKTSFYRDEDHDGHGTELESLQACQQPDGYVARVGDCDDRNNRVNPDAPELCDQEQRDENCDSAANEGCECLEAEVRSCGTDEGECETGLQICDLDGIYSLCIGNRGPEPERCNGKDDSCDGQTDETYELGIKCLVGVGACEQSGVTVCAPEDDRTICSAQPGQPQQEKCDNSDADCDGVRNNGYDVGAACEVGVGACRAEGQKVCDLDLDARVTRCDAPIIEPLPDVCGDGIDQDCDGEIDNGRLADCTVCGEPDGVTICVEGIEYCSTQFNVRNGGFEKQPVGNEVIPCWESSESPPHLVRAEDHYGPICEGEYVVRKREADSTPYTLTQRLLVVDRAQRIDAHQQHIELSAQVVSANDYTQFGFRFYDTEGILLGEQFEEFRDDEQGCQNRTYQTQIPERTRMVDVVLNGQNRAGNTNNATFDDVRISFME